MSSAPVDSPSLPSNNGTEITLLIGKQIWQLTSLSMQLRSDWNGSHAKTCSALKQLNWLLISYFLCSSLLIVHYTKKVGRVCIWGKFALMWRLCSGASLYTWGEFVNVVSRTSFEGTWCKFNFYCVLFPNNSRWIPTQACTLAASRPMPSVVRSGEW